MPPNQKKLYYPDTTYPYSFFEEKGKVADLDPNERKDGRPSGTHRPLYLKMGVVPHAKGSAYIEVGDTKLIVSVLDPKELSKQSKRNPAGELVCEIKYAPFALSPDKRSQISKLERSNSISLKKALMAAVCRQEFSNFQVDVLVFVIQDGGSVLSTAIMCAGLALIDGGIPMYDVITSATVAVMNNVILADPTSQEEDACRNSLSEMDTGIATISRLESMEQTTELNVIGSMSRETLLKATEMLIDRSQHLVKIVKQVVVQNVKERVNENKNKV